jgi:hypothetical protein
VTQDLIRLCYQTISEAEHAHVIIRARTWARFAALEKKHGNALLRCLPSGQIDLAQEGESHSQVTVISKSYSP